MSEQLQERLYNYHAQPPDKAWDKIVSVLDVESEKSLSEKLINYRATPPAFVWDNIVASFEDAQATVVPFGKRLLKPLKYVSAAASLVAVAMIVSLLLNKKSVADTVVLPKSEQNTIPLTSPSIVQKDSTVVAKKSFVNATLSKAPSANNKNKNSRRWLLQTYTSRSNKEFANRVVKNNYPIRNIEHLDRYIIFSKASGEAFRLSKKLFDLFACNDEDCKENIQAIQEKMADPSITAAGDFPAVLAMLQNIKNE